MFAPLGEPRAICPFSGLPLEYVQLSSGDWQARGKGWASTRLFQFKEQAEWFFSHNLGVAPSFPDPYRRVEVKGARAPADPAIADVSSAIKDAERFGEEAAEVMTR